MGYTDRAGKKQEEVMSDEAIAYLRSIDASLKKLVAVAERRAAANGPAVADDRDLDSAYGDETIKFMPRDWTGDSFKGCLMSECPPELLDMLAASFDYFAKKNDEKKAVDAKGRAKSTFDLRSAGRARGWAKRLRDGWKRPAPQSNGDEQSDLGDVNGAEGFGSVDDFGDSGGF